jgi:hypothetical protein
MATFHHQNRHFPQQQFENTYTVHAMKADQLTLPAIERAVRKQVDIWAVAFGVARNVR